MRSSFGLPVTRRLLLAGGALLGGVQAARLAFGGAAAQTHGPGHGVMLTGSQPSATPSAAHALHGGMMTVGEVDAARNGFDPHTILTDWDTGEVVRDGEGRRCREFVVEAIDKNVEIAPGIVFPAWTYNGRIPGPAIRVTEGERVRVRFRNRGSHPHSMHFHGIHSARMDGVPGAGDVLPGGEFVYEFEAKPFGCHLYHCHSTPLKRHIHKGLYGAYIVNPDPAKHGDAAKTRHPDHPESEEWQELVMVMNAFDTTFDAANEVYAVNSVAFHYMKHPIEIDRARPVRIYLVNVTEFDLINSFHLHANFFDYYDSGTRLEPTLRTVDTIMQAQGQRGILEFSYQDHEPGHYMFHAHVSEFAELGWMGVFDVR